MTTSTIWEKYAEEVKRFIISKVQDPHVADDLLQEVFMKVHTKKTSIKDEKKVKSWLFAVSRNTVFDHFRKTGKEVPLEKEEKIISSDDSYVHSEKDCLHGIIQNLPEKYKKPLFLADIKGEKQANIAEKLALPVSTVKSQIQRGRKLIVQGYMDCCDYKLNEKGLLVGEVKDKAQCKVCR